MGNTETLTDTKCAEKSRFIKYVELPKGTTLNGNTFTMPDGQKVDIFVSQQVLKHIENELKENTVLIQWQ